jgi:hypothetical protein
VGFLELAMKVALSLLGTIMGAVSWAAFAQTANIPPWSEQNPMTDTAIGGVPPEGTASGAPATVGKTRAQVYQDLSDFRDSRAARRMDELYRGAGN